MTINKEVREILTKVKAKGGTAKTHDDNLVITMPDGSVFEVDRSSTGMNRIRRHADGAQTREDALRNQVVFGSLNGRRGENVLSDLAKIGLELRNHPKKEKASRKVADDATESNPPSPEPEPIPEVTPMSQAVDDILANLKEVEDLLHGAVLRRAREEASPAQRIQGKLFLDWTGDLVEVIISDLKINLDPADPIQLARLERELPGYLGRNMRLKRIHIQPNGEQVWRVLDHERQFDAPQTATFSSSHQQTPTAPPPSVASAPQIEFRAPATPQQTAAPTTTPTPAPAIGETEDDVATLYRCDKCGFADFSAQSLVMHRTQVRDKADGVHPSEAYSCSLCPAVRNTTVALQTHMRGKHGPGHLCYSCAEAGTTLWFTDAEEYNKHLDAKHPHERRKRVIQVATPEEKAAGALQAAPSAPESPPEAQPASTPPEAAMERSTALSGRVVVTATPDEAIIQQVSTVLAEYPKLKAENEALRAKVDELASKLVEESERRKAAEKNLGAIASLTRAALDQ